MRGQGLRSFLFLPFLPLLFFDCGSTTEGRKATLNRGNGFPWTDYVEEVPVKRVHFATVRSAGATSAGAMSAGATSTEAM